MQLQRIVERIQETRESNPDYAPWEAYIEEGQKLLKGQEASYERPPPDTDRLYMNIGDNQVGPKCSFFVCLFFCMSLSSSFPSLSLARRSGLFIYVVASFSLARILGECLTTLAQQDETTVTKCSLTSSCELVSG